MLEPNQFEENEAWVAFQLNDDPVHTEQDGDFNCVALLDAASGFIFGTAFVSVAEHEPPPLEVRRLFETSLERSNCNPATLFIPKGKYQSVLPAEAKRHGIEVVSVQGSELLTLTAEARQGFREHFQGGAA